MRKRSALFAATLALFWWALVPSAEASSSGRLSNSYNNSVGCNECHSGGIAPTVVLDGPTSVTPGTQHELTLSVTHNGGSQTDAGLNVFGTGGVLAVGGTDSTNTQALTGAGTRKEITHTSPKSAMSGVTTFTMLWTAPSSFSSVILTGWGNSVNLSSTNSGDKAASDQLVVFSDTNGGSCTGGSQCLSGNCVDGVCCATASCPMGDNCNVAGSEGTCAAGPTPTPSPTPSPTPTRFPIDSFKVYKSKEAADTTVPFAQPAAPTVSDLFETNKLVEVIKPVAVANPVNVDGEVILNSNAHLECFKIKDSKTDPAQAKFAGRLVQTAGALESRKLKVLKPIEMCLTSNTNTIVFVPAVTYAHTHYRCYKAKDAADQSKLVSFNAQLDDEFESKLTGVLKADRLCSPVQVDTEVPDQPSAHLLCYKIKDAKTDPAPVKLAPTTRFARNFLTGTTELTASKPSLLCVPVTVTDLGPLP